MRSIIQTGNWRLHASCEPIELPGYYCFTLMSQLLTSKNPDELKRLISICCTRPELEALSRTIHKCLDKEPK